MNKIHDIHKKSDFDMFGDYRHQKEKIERERQTELLRLQMELKNATSLVQAYMRENDALKAAQVPECVLDALRWYVACADKGISPCETDVAEGLQWLADHLPKGGK